MIRQLLFLPTTTFLKPWSSSNKNSCDTQAKNSLFLTVWHCCTLLLSLLQHGIKLYVFLDYQYIIELFNLLHYSHLFYNVRWSLAPFWIIWISFQNCLIFLPCLPSELEGFLPNIFRIFWFSFPVSHQS